MNVVNANRESADHPVVAVGGVVIQDGRVLLVRRAQEPSAGTWSIPGGVLEKGETLQEGVIRELSEETGLVVRVLRLIDVAERILPAGRKAGLPRSNTARPRYHYVILDYLCAVHRGTARAGSDAAEVAWVHERELKKFALTSDLLRILRTAFRMTRTRAK